MISSGSYNVASAEQSQHVTYTDIIVCNVWLLDFTSVAFKVDKQCRGQALLDLTFDYLELLERDFFGLVYNAPQSRDTTILKWLDPNKKIKKQYSDKTTFTFWFRVKFYVPDPVCLQEEYTRYQFFLQVRKDILEGRLPVSKNTAAQLAGLALQSELGDYNSDSCRPGYVGHFRFVQQQTADFEALASDWHRKSASMAASAAELEYLNIARQLERYGVRAQDVQGEKNNSGSLTLGVSFAGIAVYRPGQSHVQFPWDNVSNIRFFGKKFTLKLKAPVMNILSHHGSTAALSRSTSGSTFALGSNTTTSPTASKHTYRFPSAPLCKSFWQYSVACHAFFRVREPGDIGNSSFVRGSRRNSMGSTAISATAAYAAVSRVTSGLRRYFSLSRASRIPASLGGGVERTLSTVMELRRSSRGSDRAFSRSLSRRSNRPSGMSSTAGPPTLQSTNLRSSHLSLSHDKTSDTQNNIPVKSYAQMPPGARAAAAAVSAGSLRVTNETKYNTAAGPPVATRGRKLLSQDGASSGQARVQQTEVHPVSATSRASSVTRPERPSRSRSVRGGSPVSGSRDSQKRIRPGSPARGDSNSPKSTPRFLDLKSRHKSSVLGSMTDHDQINNGSDKSDHESGDVDQEEAAHYWSSRRSQTVVARPNRPSLKNRLSTSTHANQDHLGPPVVVERPPVHPKTANETISETIIRNGSRSSLTFANQQGQQKKSPDGPPALHLKEHTDAENSSLNAGSSKHSNHQFVRDPFHPGAPASDPEANEGLVQIRIRPDNHKRFGFNIRGGADFQAPIIVSRVGQNMPADLCIPRLSEGDQILSINGRNVSGYTHAEVIGFICSAREDPNGVLELLVKPGDYVTDEFNTDNPVPDSGDAPPLPPRMSSTRQSTSTSMLDRLSGSLRRNGKRDTNAANLMGNFETPSTALLISILELECGLADGSIVTRFEQLPRRKTGYTMNASRMAGNILKNRYRDISPYDQTRVILQQGTEDYINASFVSMDFPKAGFAVNYIAAQGPLPSTYGDFWQMCWEQRVSVVVMLTAVSERGRMKCHQYWPDMGQTIRFSTTCSTNSSTKSLTTLRGSMDLQLQAVREEINGEFAFREFTMTHIINPNNPRSGSETRKVTQLQYITWPDHGVPNNPSDLITFVQKVRDKRGNSPAPIIVHCSAGIGRTGVLITLETAWNLMEHGQAVKPLELVQLMRAQRALLIQTSSQFQFVCETILKVFHNEYARGVLS